uniref:Zinc finger protein 569 n=1 Tax=Bactrocera dorsalis TaxID=27457 RepID=A0A034W1L8_BACDO
MQCRVCMQSKCQILFEMNILATDDGKNLYDCFNECTQLDASANDHLPKTLCKLCAQKLQIAYNFRRSARQSNEEFKKLLISQKLETDSVDSSPEELCMPEDTEESTDDPLDMSFHEALKAVKKPLEELPTEESCLVEDPDRSLEEPLMEFPTENSSLEEAPNRSLEENLLEFPTEKSSLKESSNQSLEEDLIESTTVETCLEVASNRSLEEGLMELPTEETCLEVAPSSEEPFKEFLTEKSCLEESSNQFYEETEIEIVRESTPVDNTECQDTAPQYNDEQSQVILENETETLNSFRQDEYESETEPIKKVYYDCEICCSTYTNKNELEKHVSQQHKSEVICLSCPKIFDMPIELRIHNQLVHGTDSPVQCNFCSEKPLLPRNELVKHFQTTHNSRYYWYFPYVQKRHANDTQVRSPTKYTCKYCQKIFTTVNDLAEHIRSHLFKCPFCLKNFNRMRTYYLHVKRLHNSSASQFPAIPLAGDRKDKPIQCKACNKSYANLASYNKHLKEKHNKGTRSKAKLKTTEKESSITEDVDEDITTPQNAEGEIIVNEDEDAVQAPKKSVKKEQSKKKNIPQIKEKKRFLCSYCPRVLCSNVSLASHERSQHLNSKTDIKECPICQKKLKSDYIKNHIKIVHIGERNNICDICGGAYKSPSQLKRHKLLHMPDRHLPCSVCDRKFTETSALKVHMRSHTGELPYACHLCDRQFRIRVHLTYHLEHHANIKKICKVCGKEFKDGTTLRRHSFEHNGKMPYRCTTCHYQTAKREYITTHMLRKHDIQITDEELYLMFKTNTGKSPRVKNVEYLKKLTENLQTSDNSN